MNVNNSLYSQNFSAIQRNQNNRNNVGFGKAYVNILSMGDNHGTLTTLPEIFEVIKNNFGKIFPEANEKHTLNIFAQVGDLFINPLKKGFFTSPETTAGDIQLEFFEKLNSSIKKKFKTDNFLTIYTPGNHCFEGGANWLFNKLKSIKSFETILTNVSTAETHNFVKQKVYAIPDDNEVKNPNLKHQLLVLGLTPQNLEFYAPNLKGISVIDSSEKTYAELSEENIKNTVKELKMQIKAFKMENPKGAVVLNAHVGEKISKIIAEKVPDINLILNGHDHKSGELVVNETKIVSHGQNNELVRGIRLFFDDDGNSSITATNTFLTQDVKSSKNNPISRLLYKILGKDMQPLLKLVYPENIKQKLSIEGVRYSNNPLANLITHITHKKLQKTNPELNATGIISSTFRGDLKNGASNLEIMKVLDGATESMSEMNVAKLKGYSVIDILTENVKSNIEDQDRNSIIQWSGIIINKKLFTELQNTNPEKLSEAFKIRCKDQNGKIVYRKINPEETYQLALPNKYVEKYCPKILKDSFVSTDETMNNIFMEELRNNNYQLNLDSNIFKNRIIA